MNYKAGDRARITQVWEGEIVSRELDDGDVPTICFKDDYGILHVCALNDKLTVEVLEPEYEEGAMYVDADGDYFLYSRVNGEQYPWHAPGDEMSYPPEYPTPPLRKLVPEGR